MPKRNGHEVLEELKVDLDLRILRLCILTSSSDHQDVARAYSLRANCYIQKPLDLNSWFEIVPTLEYLWSKMVVLPRSH